MDQHSGIGSADAVYGSSMQTALDAVYVRPPKTDPTDKPQRRYLPTLADLIDRYTIIRLKSIFIPEHRSDYRDELELIKHDIDLIGDEKGIKDLSIIVEGTAMLMLTNRYIWENEGKARLGKRGQEKLLKLTHSINGVRNVAKNLVARLGHERLDWKVDCFAAELVEEFGNWNVWGD